MINRSGSVVAEVMSFMKSTQHPIKTLAIGMAIGAVIGASSVWYFGIPHAPVEKVPALHGQTDVNALNQLGTPEHESVSDDDKFEAIYVRVIGRSHSSLSVGMFTLDGPDLDSLTPLPRGVRYVARGKDDRTLFGLGNHEVYRIAEGELIDITPQGNGIPELSWPVGMAYDTKRDRLIVATLGGVGYLYAYSVDSEEWSVISDMNNIDVFGLCYDESADHLVALYSDRRKSELQLLRFNSAGTLIRQQSLQTPAILAARTAAFGHGAHIQLFPHKSTITLISSPNIYGKPEVEVAET